MSNINVRNTTNQSQTFLANALKNSKAVESSRNRNSAPKPTQHKADGAILAAKPQKDVGVEVGKLQGDRDNALIKGGNNLTDPLTGKSLLPKTGTDSGLDTTTPGTLAGQTDMNDQLGKVGSRYQSSEQQINDLASQSRDAKGDRTSQTSDGWLGAKPSHITSIGIGAALGATLGGVAISGVGVAAGAAALAAGASEKLDQSDKDLIEKDDKIETEITRMAAEKAREKGKKKKAENEKKTEEPEKTENKDKTEKKDKAEKEEKTEGTSNTKEKDGAKNEKTQDDKTTPLPDGATTIEYGDESEIKARQDEIEQGLKNPGQPDMRAMPDPSLLMNAERTNSRVGWAINWGDEGPAPITGTAPTPENGVADPPEAFGGDADPTGPSVTD